MLRAGRRSRATPAADGRRAHLAAAVDHADPGHLQAFYRVAHLAVQRIHVRRRAPRSPSRRVRCLRVCRALPLPSAWRVHAAAFRRCAAPARRRALRSSHRAPIRLPCSALSPRAQIRAACSAQLHACACSSCGDAAAAPRWELALGSAGAHRAAPERLLQGRADLPCLTRAPCSRTLQTPPLAPAATAGPPHSALPLIACAAPLAGILRLQSSPEMSTCTLLAAASSHPPLAPAALSSRLEPLWQRHVQSVFSVDAFMESMCRARTGMGYSNLCIFSSDSAKTLGGCGGGGACFFTCCFCALVAGRVSSRSRLDWNDAFPSSIRHSTGSPSTLVVKGIPACWLRCVAISIAGMPTITTCCTRGLFCTQHPMYRSWHFFAERNKYAITSREFTCMNAQEGLMPSPNTHVNSCCTSWSRMLSFLI